jgi:hypothetical protein
MRCSRTIGFGALMLALGYWLGTGGGLSLPEARAQDDASTVSEDAEKKIREVNLALQEAMEQLRQDGNYTAITDGINSFLVLSGGGDARRDLESGNGVDPETFAALYAGKVLPEFAEEFGTDAEGRITFQDKPIQIYSRTRLNRMYAERARIKDADL